jgi:hypothetical protein
MLFIFTKGGGGVINGPGIALLTVILRTLRIHTGAGDNP